MNDTVSGQTASPQIVELDISGQICPSCLLLTLKTVNERSAALRSGAVEIRVFTDDRQATGTIPNAVQNMGYLAEVQRIDQRYCIRIFHA